MRIQPLRNPMGPMTRQQKVALGVAGGALLAVATLATVAWASKSDPEPEKKALEIGDGCTTFAITSEQKLRDDLRARVRSASAKGPIDPLQLTAEYVRRSAVSCPTYPANVDTPGQVKLFAAIYTQLLFVMEQDDYLSAKDLTTWYSMLTTWAAGQGVSPSDLPGV